MQPLVLIASPSMYRRWWYAEQLENRGFSVNVVGGGVECVEAARGLQPSVLILESSLLWGGSEGVLAVREEDPLLCDIPVVLVAENGITALTYRLASYSLQGFFVRIPSSSDLITTIRVNCPEHEDIELKNKLWAISEIAQPR